MDEQTVLREALKQFSSGFGDGPMGIAVSRPASWAKPAMCFANAAEKARRSRGEVCLGWMFQAKRPDFRPDSLGYLIATHHAVWLAPDRHLYDVTPYHPNEGAHPPSK